MMKRLRIAMSLMPREAARDSYSDMFDDELDEESEQSEECLRRSRGVARMLRVVLPSWWLPGKQTWGAY